MNPRRFLRMGVLGILTAWAMPTHGFCQESDNAPRGELAAQDASPTNKLVSLAIDYGNHFEKRYSGIEWHTEQTVLGAMEQARSHAHPLKFSYRGKGETAFLKSIDSQENEGGAGSNWIYYLNGQRGDRSFAVKALQPGDSIVWKFES